MTEPRTEAGKRHLAWFGGPMRPGERHNLSSAIAAIEAEATAAAEQRLRARWEHAKLTKGSVMHDVGGTWAVVDALLDTPPPASPRQGEPVDVERLARAIAATGELGAGWTEEPIREFARRILAALSEPAEAET